jgi:hypothetical protein
MCCAHRSLAAMHQLLDMYYETELFVTANREGGPLSWIRTELENIKLGKLL